MDREEQIRWLRDALILMGYKAITRRTVDHFLMTNDIILQKGSQFNLRDASIIESSIDKEYAATYIDTDGVYGAGC